MSPELKVNDPIIEELRRQESYVGRRNCLIKSGQEILYHSPGARCLGEFLAEELIITADAILDGRIVSTNPEIIDSVIKALKSSEITEIDDDPMAIHVLSAMNLSHIHDSGDRKERNIDRVNRFVSSNQYWIPSWRVQVGLGLRASDIEEYYLPRLRDEAIKGQGYPEIVRLAAEKSDFILRNLETICVKLKHSMNYAVDKKTRFDWI